MADGFIVRKGGSSQPTETPSINFVSKTVEEIVFTITNNDKEQSTIFWEVEQKNQLGDSFTLAGETTSGNITISGLEDNTEYTISVFANVAGKAGSATSSLTVTTDEILVYYLSFDGVDDYAEISANEDIEINQTGNDRTLEFIFYYDGSAARPIHQRSNDRGFVIRVNDNNTISGVLYGISGFPESSPNLITNSINHIALVLSGTTYTYFINGVDSGSFGFGNTSVNGFSDIKIAVELDNSNSITDFKTLDLYEVRIWSTALNITQISNNQARGSYTGSESGLELLYLINEGSGTTLTDATGNGNDATIFGATWVQI